MGINFLLLLFLVHIKQSFDLEKCGIIHALSQLYCLSQGLSVIVLQLVSSSDLFPVDGDHTNLHLALSFW